jgi:hypothetical protein
MVPDLDSPLAGQCWTEGVFMNKVWSKCPSSCCAAFMLSLVRMPAAQVCPMSKGPMN